MATISAFLSLICVKEIQDQYYLLSLSCKPAFSVSYSLLVSLPLCLNVYISERDRTTDQYSILPFLSSFSSFPLSSYSIFSFCCFVSVIQFLISFHPDFYHSPFLFLSSPSSYSIFSFAFIQSIISSLPSLQS